MRLSDRTAVVISAHRPYQTLDSCLSGFCSIVDEPGDLIFVNNGSSEPLRRLVSARFPGITAINTSENRLFCAGYNAGIRVALERNYDFVLMVNADTEVLNPAFVRQLLEAAKRWPRAAFLGPLVYYRDRESIQNTRLRFPSVVRNVLTWIPWRISRGAHSHPPLWEGEVEFLNGVCVLCRCAALNDFGLMDERYGGYVEDADWGWRARKRGWQSVFVPIPGIIHHEEQEGYEHFSFKSFLLKRNTVLWYLKVGRRSSAFLYAFASVCLAWARMLLAANASARSEHKRFLWNLSRSYRRLMCNNHVAQGLGPFL
jgi:N-acetylglucosaminyl-diphospho-decaprenol L-rhamnosyltransferase